MVPLVQASPRADCPHRRPPYLHMQPAQHPMRPCLQSPQRLPTCMTLALLCLQGATGGGCLKRVKPKPGSPLLGSSFCRELLIRVRACRIMYAARGYLPLNLPPPPVHAVTLHIPAREHPLPCLPPLTSMIYSIAHFLVCM